MKKLTDEEWEIVFGNIEDIEELEINWLDSSDEWIINVEYEVLEDGFKTEKEAMKRLEEITKKTC